jgi:hypothetical protein
MSRIKARLLFWSPRLLCIAFAALLSLFVLDVFSQRYGFWQSAEAFAIHLIPALIVVAVLVVAWWWQWIGALLFTVAGILYAVRVLPKHPGWVVTVAMPLWLIAALFLAEWLNRTKVRSARLSGN